VCACKHRFAPTAFADAICGHCVRVDHTLQSLGLHLADGELLNFASINRLSTSTPGTSYR